MDYGLIAFAIGLFIAYYLGRHAGLREAHLTAIRTGAWVEVIRTVRCTSQYNDDDRLSAGTQGIVLGIDKWGRMCLWVALPITELRKPYPIVYHVTNGLTRLRARPLHDVDEATRKRTLAAMDAAPGLLIPRLFLEEQRY